MKAQTMHHDYGIYTDRHKAFIVAINEFDRAQPSLVRTELNTEEESAAAPSEKAERVRRMQAFSERVLALLEEPHRVLLFGPSEDKYELHKLLQKQFANDSVLKELLVSPEMATPDEAQRFTEAYFSSRAAF